jgi:hypothetical protein
MLMLGKKLHLVFGLILCLMIVQHAATAQWGAPYANSWINYSKPYLKIGVIKKGLHKIPYSSLPKNFPVDKPDNLQLWRRGKQVAIISTSNQEIVFYAVPNDGASDSLLYRPMSARLNPYFSMYSDEGSYFLTIGDTLGARAKTTNQQPDSKTLLLPFHKELAITNYQEEYSLSTDKPIRPKFLNSFFELGASRTGKVQDAATWLVRNFTLENFVNTSQKPTIKLLVHGRGDYERKIGIYVGKTFETLRLVTTLSNSGFSGSETSFELEPGDIDAAKGGVLALKTMDSEKYARFSLAYFSIEYRQSFQMNGKSSKEFRLEPVATPWSRVTIQGASSNFNFLDISDINNPAVIKGAFENLMVPRQLGKMQVLLATRDTTNVDSKKIQEVKFKAPDPKEPNYIIITTGSLMPGAMQFASYRASEAGGGFKPVVVNIKDIYNQFNYGEPSPVAIKKFMSYMLADGAAGKNLFLIGKSITFVERMKRELPEEVPTIGHPGSDLMLVEGIAGLPRDLPAVPIGRLSAITNQNVLDYLQKVKDYEDNSAGDLAWRKKVLHLSGGKNTSEITQLKQVLSEMEPNITQGLVGGNVKQYVKQQAMAETEFVNITPAVNEGAGLITFLGHGSPIITDPDLGFASDAARGYNNLHKYPLMYFNGCGVGNIFSARFNFKPKNPQANDRLTLSLDWLLTPDRGAVAIIANTFESFVGTASEYLETLYTHMFTDPSTAGLPIGKIQQTAAKSILTKKNDKYSIANVHQSLLQGDPVLRLIVVDKPDYAIDPDKGITLHAQSPDQSIGASDSVKVQIDIANNGRFVKEQLIPLTVTYLGKSGHVIKTQDVKAFPYQKTLFVSFLNSKDIRSVKVELDPKFLVSELSENNNVAELTLDWEVVKSKSSFSYSNMKDNVAPLLEVKFDDKLLKQDGKVRPDPIITLHLSDDRQLFVDSSLVDIYIKRCWTDDCDFEKVAYSAGKAAMISNNGRTLEIRYASDLAAGFYEILVNARDRQGNAAAQPYRSRFEVFEQVNLPTKLIVSPNPASSYARFELNFVKSQDLKTIKYLIYSAAGKLVEEKSISVQAWSSAIEWYWMPPYMNPGLYTYKVLLISSGEATVDVLTGKIVLVR